MQDTPFKIYNASAGSGKTYTLAKEYLKIIFEKPKGYKQILAITFTNKAVNEMKYRILNNLYAFSLKSNIDESSPMFNELVKELKIKPVKLQQKSKKILKEILHNYAFFDVSTIDKFTHRLIRTFAKDLKLPQNFEVVLDVDLLLEEAVSRLINNAGKDPKLTKALVDFAIEKIDDDKSWDIAHDLNKIGKLLFNETNVTHLRKLSNKQIDDFLELQNEIKKKISTIESQLTSSASSALLLISKNGLEFKNFSGSYFPKFIEKIQQGYLDIDFKAGWKQNFKTSLLYSKSCDESTKILMDKLHPEFIKLFYKIKKHSERRQLLINVYKNIVPLTVLNKIQQEIKVIELERDQLSISEFNNIISNEIKNQPAPFIYERLGEKYSHYFIDEFQDTSEMQWGNLIPLVSNALESEDIEGNKGSLFLVGDAKQAIYRWRGGNAEQFLNMVNLKTNPFMLPPYIENLPFNYRSHEEIIKFNNDFFSITCSFLKNEIYNELFKKGNKQLSNAKKGGLVQITFLDSDDTIDTDYCTEVLNTIKEVKEKKFNYKHICILVRSNKEGVVVANFLTQQQIPVISSESLLLKSSPKITFLINLMYYHNEPKNLETRYNLLSFLAPKEENKHDFIASNLDNISFLLSSKYHFEVNYMKRLSAYDTLEYAIKQFKLILESDAYINHFMDNVLNVEQKEGTSISTFLTFWEKKKNNLCISAPSTIDAVQIMTIHKSKGLEFPIVIYPYANSNIYKEIEPKLWLPVNNNDFNGFNEVLISKKQEIVNYNETAEALYTQDQFKLELDAFNILYVATTRAVRGLYIISKKDLTKSGAYKTEYYSGLLIHYLKEKNLWNELQNKYTFGELSICKEIVNLETQGYIPYLYSYKDRPSFKILTKSNVLWNTHREEALYKGNLIHYIMSLIKTERDVENAFEIVLRNGDIKTEEIIFLRAKVNEILQHPLLNIYFKKGNIVKNETEIITENGKILRPDRIVINNDNATIIDYKTGKINTSYKEQLYRYSDALRCMGYKIKNRIIIYINEKINIEVF